MSVSKGNATSVLSQSFVDNNEDVTEDEAMLLIVKAEQKIKALEEERASDDNLTAAKQIVKDLNAGYSAALKNERAKINFLLDKIQEIESGSVNPTSSLNASK